MQFQQLVMYVDSYKYLINKCMRPDFLKFKYCSHTTVVMILNKEIDLPPVAKNTGAIQEKRRNINGKKSTGKALKSFLEKLKF